jgi:hypothetical protein
MPFVLVRIPCVALLTGGLHAKAPHPRSLDHGLTLPEPTLTSRLEGAPELEIASSAGERYPGWLCHHQPQRAVPGGQMAGMATGPGCCMLCDSAWLMSQVDDSSASSQAGHTAPGRARQGSAGRMMEEGDCR